LKIKAADGEKQKDKFSEELSSRSRAVNLGVLAVTWSILAAKQSLQQQATQFRTPLLEADSFAVTAILLDLVQYLAGFTTMSRFLRKLQLDQKDEGYLNPKEFFYRASYAAFWAKLLFSTLGSVWLLITLAWILTHP
jgi:hypothetical protein